MALKRGSYKNTSRGADATPARIRYQEVGDSRGGETVPSTPSARRSARLSTQVNNSRKWRKRYPSIKNED